ncbi:hypothetical protein Cgig2_001746 [Carnegiea gigantea]|uniref:Uncharacterized protein n=1 Tax=Carnegiea gigantea TaxID=171969 RepID=A0A9Q1K8N5_9CARY|nr:hypothetical protein Cgig2_001746 [Carnegiea gigantea]
MVSTSQLSETLPQFLVDVSGVMDEVQVVDVTASKDEQPDDMDEFEQREWDDAKTGTENDDDEMQYKSDDDDEDDEDDDEHIDNKEDWDEDDEYKDPRCQRRRRGGARLFDADSHSPEAVGVGEHTYGSPVRVPLIGVNSTSFMPTPRMDACIGNPFLVPNQVPGRNQDAGLQASYAGDTSGAGGVNTAFWNTFGSFIPYNANLIMSALGSMQQGQPLPQSPLHSPPPLFHILQ